MSISNVRVRFAPSPTGYLHIGSLRTALFNYLFARHNGGKFILRIEDTDQSRKVDGAVENLISTLNEMGLIYDEGPEIGGEFGPYFQSQRLEIYKQHCLKLIESGHAYYAFETPDELESMRKAQLDKGLQTMYDKGALRISANEVKAKLDSGIPYVIRLNVPKDQEIGFTDIIRGKVSIETNLIDDQVLLKSDGYPTYHLANVVDDHLMNISHIIRGEEWLTSVPKHIILYNAFGWDIPQMAHVPLILNPDKSKLSKRQGDVATEDYLNKGYLKEALINFAAFLGWNPGDDNLELLSLGELEKLFTLERVHSAGAVFNIDKLNWMNAEYIKKLSDEELSTLSLPYFKSAGFYVNDNSKLNRVMHIVKNYVQRLDEIPEQAKVYFTGDFKLDKEQNEFLSSGDSQMAISLIIQKLDAVSDVNSENFKPLVSELQKETGIKGKNLFRPLRLALTGLEHGPDLGLIAYALGKEELLYRFNKALASN